MPEPVKGNGRYMAGLDGLRALAVLAVILYHLNPGFAPGGLLGVGAFFVLSGYLITDLLVTEWEDEGQIDLKQFWLRRGRRLLPALFLMLVVVVCALILFARTRLAALRGDVLAAMLYASNWWFIYHNVSYFARFGPPSPLGHLWSLAVEGQFYLFWPLLLWFGLRRQARRGLLLGLTLAGAAASALAMAILYRPGSDPSRVYYGTDTRAFALLIGAALALVWPSRKLSAKVSPLTRLGIDLAGCAGLLVMLVMIWRTNQYDTFLYPGGLLLLSVATAVLVAAIAHPASRLGKVLGGEPLRWLGVRSYGIYLWHYPVIVLTSPVVNTGGVNVVRMALQLSASIILAALSWRFVEEPVRRGALRRLREVIPLRARHRRCRLPLRNRVALAAAGLAFGIFCLGITGVIPTTDANHASNIANIAPAGQVSIAAPGPIKPGSDKSGNSGKGRKTPTESSISQAGPGTTGDAATPGQEQNPDQSSGGSRTSTGTPEPVAITTGSGITAIGDSVLADAAPYLSKLLPGIVIDTKIGRQMSEAQAVVHQLKAQGRLGDRLIIELGTNGPFTKEQLVALLNSLEGVQQVFLVNTRVPRPWEDVVNTTLAQVAATRPHTTLVDWYAASAGHDSYFYPDGVHLTPIGAQSYANLVAGTVRPIKN